MDEIMVVYWSQTGNTEAMAQAVAQGIEEAGKKAKLAEVSAVSAADLKDAKAFALGCPAMGAEVIDYVLRCWLITGEVFCRNLMLLVVMWSHLVNWTKLLQEELTSTLMCSLMKRIASVTAVPKHLRGFIRFVVAKR